MKKFLLAIAVLFIGFSATAQSGQCNGKKLDGTRCKIKTKDASGYCYLHDPKAIRCGKIKKDGKPCRIILGKGQTACRFHSRGS